MRGMVCALLASAIGLSSGVLAQPQAPAAGVVPIPSDSPGFVPGQVLVMPARGEDPWAVAHRLETGSVPIDEVETEIPLLLEGLAARGRVIRLAVPVHSELEVAAALSARPDVEFAVPNYFGTVGAVTSPVYEEVLDQFANPTDVRSTTDLDDPRAPDQWHLDPLASRGYIGVDALWSTPGTSGGAVIAVLDSGVDYNHPDLVGRIAPGGYDFVNEDDDPLADHPHGTYVAGAIVANQKNGFQTAGVDRGASIVPVKVISQYLFGTTLDLYEGLMHVASLDHVDIVSMSLVNYRRSPLIDEGLRALRDSGKIVIACAGNGSFGSADRSFPGASPLTISVGATDDFDRIGDFSGTGAALDLVAPGVDVVTLDASYDPGAAAVVSGCSFATPITAGVVASLFSYAKSLGIQLTHEQALAMLSIGAQDNLGDSRDTLGRDDYYGYGRLDAAATLHAFQDIHDCNRNGVRDEVDLAGGLADLNGDGLLDDCQPCSEIDLSYPFGKLTYTDAHAYVSAFREASAVADLAEPPGVFSANDIIAFIDRFNDGCDAPAP